MIDKNKDNQKEGRILIVDDNLANVKLLERVLSLSGYAGMRTVTDPREVLGIYVEYKPEIILLDINMPHLDGFQVLEQLKEARKDDYFSVIMITAQSEPANRMRALDLGVNDFIGKPFDTTEVLMRIRNMLQIRKLHQQVLEQNRHLENRVEERTRELLDLQIELLTRLARAAEFRDDDTGNHIVRIGRYVSALAKLTGDTGRSCEHAGYASMMHDIGKIGIPDDILMKPGPLTDSEWELMKTHTDIGGDILSNSTHDIIRLGEAVARSHHEWWNGTGYPDSLSGEEIPTIGRIVAICDVFDALLSTRPYKKPWHLDVTLETIRRKSGTQFDPDLVAKFLDNSKVFIDIWQSFQDKEID